MTFTGQNIGIRKVEDAIWLVNFMDYFDLEACGAEPYWPERVNHVSGRAPVLLVLMKGVEPSTY